MRRRMGRPGLVGTMARTAVIAGTATATVERRQPAPPGAGPSSRPTRPPTSSSRRPRSTRPRRPRRRCAAAGPATTSSTKINELAAAAPAGHPHRRGVRGGQAATARLSERLLDARLGVLACLPSSAPLLVVANVAIVVCALVVLPGGRRPQTAMAWLLLILVIPFFGFLLFLLFGRTSVGRSVAPSRTEVNAAILAAAHLEDIEDHERRLELPPLVQSFARLNRRLGVLPLSFGNTVELIDDYQGGIEADGPRGRDGHRLRARAVLHLGVGRDDRAVLRGAGPRHRARGDGAVPLRPHRVEGHPGLQGDAGQARGHGDPVGADAADPAAEG